MKTIFEIGYEKEEIDFSIKGTFYKKLTREEYNEIIRITFYCLKELEKFGIKDDYEIAGKN